MEECDINNFSACIRSDYIRTFTWDKKLEMVIKTSISTQGKNKFLKKSKKAFFS